MTSTRQAIEIHFVDPMKSRLLWFIFVVFTAVGARADTAKGLLVVYDGKTLRQNAPAYEYAELTISRGGFRIKLVDGSIVTGMAGAIVAKLEYQNRDADALLSNAETIARQYAKAVPILEPRIEQFRKSADDNRPRTEPDGVKSIAEIAISPKTEDIDALTGASSSEDWETKKWAIRGLGKLNDSNAFQRLDGLFKSGRVSDQECAEIIKQYGRMASGPRTDLATMSLDRLIEIHADKNSGSEMAAKARDEILNLAGQDHGWIKGYLEVARVDYMAPILKQAASVGNIPDPFPGQALVSENDSESQLDYGLLVKQAPERWSDGSGGTVAGAAESGLVAKAFRVSRAPFPLDFRCFSLMRGWSGWATVNDHLEFADDDSLEAIQFRFPKGIPTGVRIYGRVRVGNVGWLRTLQIEDQVVLGATSKGWRIEAIQLYSSVGNLEEYLPQWQSAVGILDQFIPGARKSDIASKAAPDRMFPDEPGIGRWMWSSGSDQTEFWIQANGLAHRPSIRAVWERLNTLEYPAFPPTYRIRGNNDSADTMTMNWDGSVMNGTNQNSRPICAVRVDGENQLHQGQRPSVDLERKLEALILPNLEFENAPLEKVISDLQKLSVDLDRNERDSEKRGIRFRIENPGRLPIGSVTWNKKDASMRYAVDQAARRSGTIAWEGEGEVVFVPRSSGSFLEAETPDTQELKTRWMQIALGICGEWKAENDPNHYFLRANQTARHWRDKGTWTIENGIMKVNWDNGYTSDVLLVGQRDSLDWKVYRPGRFNPTVIKMTRVK